jgi:hypothetical protein
LYAGSNQDYSSSHKIARFKDTEKHHCSVRPSQRTKGTAAIDKRCVKNCNCGCAYADWSNVVLEALGIIRLGAVATGGRMLPSGKLSLMKINLVGWMSGVEARRLGSLWLMRSVTWRGEDHFG